MLSAKVFICGFDPFGLGCYIYTIENVCLEDHTLKLREGRKTVFLSTQGENPSEVPEKLVRFLHFVKADLRESQCPSGDSERMAAGSRARRNSRRIF